MQRPSDAFSIIRKDMRSDVNFLGGKGRAGGLLFLPSLLPSLSPLCEDWGPLASSSASSASQSKRGQRVSLREAHLFLERGEVRREMCTLLSQGSQSITAGRGRRWVQEGQRVGWTIGTPSPFELGLEWEWI